MMTIPGDHPMVGLSKIGKYKIKRDHLGSVLLSLLLTRSPIQTFASANGQVDEDDQGDQGNEG